MLYQLYQLSNTLIITCNLIQREGFQEASSELVGETGELTKKNFPLSRDSNSHRWSFTLRLIATHYHYYYSRAATILPQPV